METARSLATIISPISWPSRFAPAAWAGQAGPQEDVGHLLADRAVGRAQDPVQIRQYVPFQPRAAQPGQPAAGDEPGRLVVQRLEAHAAQIHGWRGPADHDIQRMVAQLAQQGGALASWMVAVMPRPCGCGRWRPTASGPRRREWRRCSGAPRDRWPGLPFPGPCGPGRGPGRARAHHRAQRVGVMPRAERSNSGTPNMLSSSDRALVTAGWLVAICSATRVSDPCCSICSSSIRCRILSREPSFRTTSSGLNEVIYWGHS